MVVLILHYYNNIVLQTDELTVEDDVTVPIRRGDEAHAVLVQSVHQQPFGGHSNIKRDIRAVSEIL